MTFRRDLDEWLAKQVSHRVFSGPTEDIRRLLRGAESGSLNPVVSAGLPSEILAAYPPGVELPPVDFLWSGLAFGLAYAGKSVGMSFDLSDWCAASATVDSGSTPDGVPRTDLMSDVKMPALYTGRMRLIVQRMLGAGYEPEWDYKWLSSAWIYTASDDSDWVIECSAVGITAALLEYDQKRIHTCDDDGLVPIGKGEPIQIADVAEVAPYFATTAIYADSGWAASEDGDVADNLSWGIHADGYTRISHWRIGVTELNGVPDAATLSLVNDYPAWSAFEGGTCVPASQSTAGVFDVRMGNDVPPPWHPTKWPVAVWYEGASLQIYYRSDLQGNATPYDDYPDTAGWYCPPFQGIGCWPPGLTGTNEWYTGKRDLSTRVIEGPGVATASQGFTTAGYLEEVCSTQGHGITGKFINILDDTVIAGSPVELYKDRFHANTETTSAKGQSAWIPCGDRQAIMVMTKEVFSTLEPTEQYIEGGIVVLDGTREEDLFGYDNSPSGKWKCCDSQAEYHHRGDALSPATEDVRNMAYIQDWRYSASCEDYKGHGYIYCEQDIVGHVTNDGLGAGPEVPGSPIANESYTVLLHSSSDSSLNVDSGVVPPNDWEANLINHSGSATYVLVNASGDGVAIGKPGQLSVEGTAVGSIDAIYRSQINSYGMVGIWIGTPEL